MHHRLATIAIAASVTLSLGFGATARQIGSPAAGLRPFETAAAETASPDAQARGTIESAARTTIARAGLATFVTVDDAGHPQARIVDPFPVEDDFTVWIGTTAASRKVAQIAKDPRVSLLYFDRSGGGYVTLLGRAEIVRDAREKARRWKDEWSAFYADRNRGDDYVLIRVVTSRLEISAPALGMNNDPATWTPVILKLR